VIGSIFIVDPDGGVPDPGLALAGARPTSTSPAHDSGPPGRVMRIASACILLCRFGPDHLLRSGAWETPHADRARLGFS